MLFVLLLVLVTWSPLQLLGSASASSGLGGGGYYNGGNSNIPNYYYGAAGSSPGGQQQPQQPVQYQQQLHQEQLQPEQQQQPSSSDPSSDSSSPDQPLPPGWTEHLDPSSGQYYYYCAADGTTTWDRPRSISDNNTQALPEEEEGSGNDLPRVGTTGAALDDDGSKGVEPELYPESQPHSEDEFRSQDERPSDYSEYSGSDVPAPFEEGETVLPQEAKYEPERKTALPSDQWDSPGRTDTDSTQPAPDGEAIRGDGTGRASHVAERYAEQRPDHRPGESLWRDDTAHPSDSRGPPQGWGMAPRQQQPQQMNQQPPPLQEAQQQPPPLQQQHQQQQQPLETQLPGPGATNPWGVVGRAEDGPRREPAPDRVLEGRPPPQDRPQQGGPAQPLSRTGSEYSRQGSPTTQAWGTQPFRSQGPPPQQHHQQHQLSQQQQQQGTMSTERRGPEAARAESPLEAQLDGEPAASQPPPIATQRQGPPPHLQQPPLAQRGPASQPLQQRQQPLPLQRSQAQVPPGQTQRPPVQGQHHGQPYRPQTNPQYGSNAQWNVPPYGQSPYGQPSAYGTPPGAYGAPYGSAYGQQHAPPPTQTQSPAPESGSQLVESSTVAVREALGKTWQGLLGFGSKTKEVVDTARNTVVASAKEATQTLSTTSSSTLFISFAGAVHHAPSLTLCAFLLSL